MILINGDGSESLKTESIRLSLHFSQHKGNALAFSGLINNIPQPNFPGNEKIRVLQGLFNAKYN